MKLKGRRQFVAINSLYPPADVRRLHRLAERTRISQSQYLREALDDLLRKHAASSRRARTTGMRVVSRRG